MQNDPLKKLIELTNGDDAFIREMLEIFIRNTPESMRNINASLKKKDFEAISAFAHKLKSSIQIVGDNKLHDLVKQIESEAKTEARFKKLSTLIKNLSRELSLLVSWMQERIDDPTKFS
jgi:HPt (histidine-containing phosphotransfer) domain-containing protein